MAYGTDVEIKLLRPEQAAPLQIGKVNIQASAGRLRATGRRRLGQNRITIIQDA
ncbi:MAG: hypothetical protein KGL70_16440 [Betaproteobacteria bacterium]|nr:hypothetical protein [Betaproteobacteria bacterium]MDE2209360.1 hypothetical protein [Betaproteobacteria bacterium]MDE2360964.1 hypothetical protein [Betaproteobacteria bacterium]